MKLVDGPCLRRGVPTAELCPAWSELLDRSAAASAFLSPEWLLPWWLVYGPKQGRQPWTFTFWRGGQLIGFVPLCLRTHYPRYGVPLRRWEIWGSGEAEADAVCSDYLNVLASSGNEAEVAVALERCLQKKGLAEEIVIPLMDASLQQTMALQQAFRQGGWWVEVQEPTESRWIELPATWEAYLAGLKSSARYWIRRTLRDLEQWAGPSLQVREVQHAEELPRFREQLILLHQERWQARHGGTFRSPLFLDFHQRIQEQWLARDQLQFAVLWCHQQPVAAVYNLRWRDQVLFYQCGRSLQVPRGLRPGAWLLAWCIRRAIQGGYRRFDFLAGVAHYKTQFASQVRPLVQLRMRRPTVQTRLQSLVEQIKPVLRRWLRRSPESAVFNDDAKEESVGVAANSGPSGIR